MEPKANASMQTRGPNIVAWNKSHKTAYFVAF